MKKLPVFLAALLCLAAQAEEVKKDTIRVKEKDVAADRNVMLNAESASVPRDLSIGFSVNVKGATVCIEDMKHAYTIPGRSQYHWAGGNAYEPTGSVDLINSVIKYGEIAILVDSKVKLGGDRFSGAFTGMTSSNGLLRFDGAINGPLNKAKGWYYSFGAYVNFDPTNVNSPSRKYVDKKQIIVGSLSKRWRSSSLDFIYTFSLNQDNVEGGYSKAPFIYNGDGSITALPGFRIGRDNYMPVDESISYMDIRTGKMVTTNVGDIDRRRTHDLWVRYRNNTANGWNLNASTHFYHMPVGDGSICYVKGIDKVEAGAGYTNPDGTAFAGYVQNRLNMAYETAGTGVELAFKAEKKFRRQKISFGIIPSYSYQMEAASSSFFAHTVAANPSRIYFGGQASWGFNTGSTFYSADTILLPIYAIHEWTPNDRWVFKTGVRLKYLWWNDQVYSEQENGMNKRVNGFNLADPSMAVVTPLQRQNVNYSLSEHISFRIRGRLFAIAEGFYCTTDKGASYFKSATFPTPLPIGNAQARGGLMYDNSWCDVSATASYITNWNTSTILNVTKQIGGISETIPYTAEFGMGTFGLTLDGSIHFGGFKLHSLITWQDPRYKNYCCEFKFSDGSKTVIDYTGKKVVGISQWLLELDPSYQFEHVRLWASARYFGKQYVSRTNYAWFNGHFETFAGADVKFDDHHKISINIVNVLGQNGATGSIDSADTVQDPSELKGLVMSGSYIRPLTVELGYTYKF